MQNFGVGRPSSLRSDQMSAPEYMLAASLSDKLQFFHENLLFSASLFGLIMENNFIP